MSGFLVIVFAISIAFYWVEVLKLWKHIKPFNCMPCMTGWTALIIAYCYDVQLWYFYLFVGLFVGALFTAIKYRYL